MRVMSIFCTRTVNWNHYRLFNMPLRSCTAILQTQPTDSPILFLYSDAGPEQWLTYMSIKLSLISVAPYHSFRNHAKRVTTVWDLGLQSVGVACSSMEDEVKAIVSKWNSVADIQRVAKDTLTVKQALIDSVAHAKTTVTAFKLRWKLKGKKFNVGVASQPDEHCELWSTLKKFDPAFTFEHSKKTELLWSPQNVPRYHVIGSKKYTMARHKAHLLHTETSMKVCLMSSQCIH